MVILDAGAGSRVLYRRAVADIINNPELESAYEEVRIDYSYDFSFVASHFNIRGQQHNSTENFYGEANLVLSWHKEFHAAL